MASYYPTAAVEVNNGEEKQPKHVQAATEAAKIILDFPPYAQVEIINYLRQKVLSQWEISASHLHEAIADRQKQLEEMNALSEKLK
jgi:hypothetical protein